MARGLASASGGGCYAINEADRLMRYQNRNGFSTLTSFGAFPMPPPCPLSSSSRTIYLQNIHAKGLNVTKGRGMVEGLVQDHAGPKPFAVHDRWSGLRSC